MSVDAATASEVLHLDGDLCIAELPAVRRQIEDAIAGGVRDLVLDLSAATLLTAAALRVFESTEQRLGRLGGSLHLRNPAPLPQQVLEITGFARLVDVPSSA